MSLNLLSWTRSGAVAISALVAVLFQSAPVMAQTPAAKAPAAAEAKGPALWVIKDADSTLYLYGTIHLLKPDTVWHGKAVDEALAASSELILEVPNADDQQAAMPLVQKYGLNQDKPLSQKLTAEDNAKLAQVLKPLGQTPAQAEPLRPWLMGIQLSLLPIVKAGYDPKSGVEYRLKDLATKAGKPVSGFETLEQQIQIFATMSEKDEVDFLRKALQETDEGSSKLDALVQNWSRGDVKGLETEFVTQLKSFSPSLYQSLLVNRNKDWAQKIKTKLDGKGVTFIAVGAGHLVGPDSVQVQLSALGIKAERIN